MKRIFIPTRDGTDWQRLLAKPTLHWKKGASAMTAAASWEDASGELPAEIASLLSGTGEPGLVDLRLLAALPEWEVALPGGDTTSNTDVLAICRNESGLCVVAVEAKVLEDFGPLLKVKREGASSNQEHRVPARAPWRAEVRGCHPVSVASSDSVGNPDGTAVPCMLCGDAGACVWHACRPTVGFHCLLRSHRLDRSFARRLACGAGYRSDSVLGLVRRRHQVPRHGFAKNGACGHITGAS